MGGLYYTGFGLGGQMVFNFRSEDKFEPFFVRC